MNRFIESYRRLAILSAVASGDCVNQRALAARLDVSLGLVNKLLRQLQSQRLTRMDPSDDRRYVLTQRGVAAMAKFSVACAAEADVLLTGFRDELNRMAARLRAQGRRKALLCGDGPTAELVAGALRSQGIQPVGAVAENPGALPVAGLRVRKIEEARKIKHDVCVAMTATDASAIRRVLGRQARVQQAVRGR